MIYINKEDGSYTIGRVDGKIFPQVINLYQRIFHDSYHFTSLVMTESVKAISIDMDGDKVVSIALYREKHILENNELIKVPFIFGVGTHEDYRHQNRAHKVINGMLNYLKEKGYDRVLLAPANKSLYDFYSHFGFERYSFFEYKQGRIDNKYILYNAGIKDINAMLFLFNRNAYLMKNCQFRKWKEMYQKVKETKMNGGNVMLATKDNRIVGYYFEDNDIVESIGIDCNYNKRGKTRVFCSKE